MPDFINPAFEGTAGKSAVIRKIQKLSYAERIRCQLYNFFSKLLASVQSGLVSAFFFNIQFMDSVKT